MYLYLKKINYSLCFAISLIFTIINIESAAIITPPPPPRALLPTLTSIPHGSLDERFFTAVYNHEHISIIREFIRQGADVNRQHREKPLLRAIINYDIEIVQELINSGAEISDFDMKYLEDMKHIENEKPNKLQLKEKRLEIIKLLENERIRREKKKQEYQEIIAKLILNVPNTQLFMDITRIISQYYPINTGIDLFEFEKLNTKFLDTLITQNKLKRTNNNANESNGTKKAKLSSEAITSLIQELEKDNEALIKRRAECKNFEELLELEANIEKNQTKIDSLKK